MNRALAKRTTVAAAQLHSARMWAKLASTEKIEALSNVDGTPREIVVLNAGAGLYAAGLAASIAEGIARARESIASGAAKKKLDAFVATTQKLGRLSVRS